MKKFLGFSRFNFFLRIRNYYFHNTNDNNKNINNNNDYYNNTGRQKNWHCDKRSLIPNPNIIFLICGPVFALLSVWSFFGQKLHFRKYFKTVKFLKTFLF